MTIWLSAEALFCCLQKIVQEIHALNLLLKISASIDIQGKRYILVTKYFRERFDVELRYLDCPYCKSMPYLMELHLL